MEHQQYYRDCLEQELKRRYQDNPHYSLRSFAKYLELEPSLLSKLLRGTRRITPKMINRLSKKVKVLDQTPDRTEEFKALDIDIFQAISQWYHWAILEMVLIDDKRLTPAIIARKLNILYSEAKAAMERLVRLHLLTRLESGRWMTTSHTIQLHGDTSLAQKQLQHEYLRMAQRALDEVSIKERDQSGMTMAIDRKDLPLAQEFIKEFRRKFCHLLQYKKKKDAVYQLMISFFPLTKNSYHFREDV